MASEERKTKNMILHLYPALKSWDAEICENISTPHLAPRDKASIRITRAFQKNTQVWNQGLCVPHLMSFSASFSLHLLAPWA